MSSSSITDTTLSRIDSNHIWLAMIHTSLKEIISSITSHTLTIGKTTEFDDCFGFMRLTKESFLLLECTVASHSQATAN
jgi:hypothetical protein